MGTSRVKFLQRTPQNCVQLHIMDDEVTLEEATLYPGQHLIPSRKRPVRT